MALIQSSKTRSVMMTTLSTVPSMTVYPSNPEHSGHLDTVAKAAIGATVGSAGMLLIIILPIWMRQQRKRNAQEKEEQSLQFGLEEQDNNVTDTTSSSDSAQPKDGIAKLEQPEQKVELPERGIWQERAELPTMANAVELDIVPRRWKEEDDDGSVASRKEHGEDVVLSPSRGK